MEMMIAFLNDYINTVHVRIKRKGQEAGISITAQASHFNTVLGYTGKSSSDKWSGLSGTGFGTNLPISPLADF